VNDGGDVKVGGFMVIGDLIVLEMAVLLLVGGAPYYCV